MRQKYRIIIKRKCPSLYVLRSLLGAELLTLVCNQRLIPVKPGLGDTHAPSGSRLFLQPLCLKVTYCSGWQEEPEKMFCLQHQGGSRGKKTAKFLVKQHDLLHIVLVFSLLL